MTELTYELADVIEEALEPHMDRMGDIRLSAQGIAHVAAEAIEAWMIDRGVA